MGWKLCGQTDNLNNPFIRSCQGNKHLRNNPESRIVYWKFLTQIIDCQDPKIICVYLVSKMRLATVTNIFASVLEKAD